MAKQTPLLVKSFAADTAIANANVCVVMSGSNAGNVALPGGALATKFVGVTFEPVASGSLTNEIGVQVAGIARFRATARHRSVPGTTWRSRTRAAR